MPQIEQLRMCELCGDSGASQVRLNGTHSPVNSYLCRACQWEALGVDPALIAAYRRGRREMRREMSTHKK